MLEIEAVTGIWTTIEPSTVTVRWDGPGSQIVQYDEETNAVYLPPYDPETEGSYPLWNVTPGDAPPMRIGDIPEVKPDSDESMWPAGFTVVDGKWQMI